MPSISNQTMNWAREHQLRHWYKDETTSTNLIAKEELDSEVLFKIYLANYQTEGRGRGSNSWSNPKEKNSLLSTWCYKTNESPQHFLPALVGLALLEACRSTWSGLAWSLKAPNDLYINDKKIAGLLIETVSQGDHFFVLIGLGFNVFSAPENVEGSSYLVNFLGEKMNFDNQQWVQFLNQLKSNLDESIESSSQVKISQEKRDLLLEALNANPWKKETYIEVSDQADLITESATISWREL